MCENNNSRELSRIFKILSVQNRVKIIQLLKEDTLCVNALAKKLDISPAAVSQHLRILRNADIVTDDKQGYYVHYSINKDKLHEWKELASELLSN